MLLPMLVEDARPKAHPNKDEVKRSLLSQLSFARRFARDQEGSFTIFSLFIFVLIILIGGMAVDLMRFETRRTALQNTVDSAVLAAANIDQTIEAEALVKSFFEKSGFDPDLVTVPEPEESIIGADPDTGEGGTLVARTVEANVDLSIDTYFMHMMGINELATMTASQASESIQNVEISLIVDISGSMSGNKMTTLKTEAKKFFREVIDEEADVQSTTVSIIPYNHTVVAGADLLSRLNVVDGTGLVLEPYDYPGSLTTFPITHGYSHCIRFDDDMFEYDNLEAEYEDLRAIVPPHVNGLGETVPGTPLTRQAHYDHGGDDFNKPSMWERECDNTRTPILVHESRLSVLDAHINRLIASGNTAIDNGMKWGVALLDPAMRPLITDMIDNNLVHETAENRPGEYDSDETMKVVVLMTDGKNTRQLGLKDQYLNGPSRVWYSEKAADQDESDYIVDANKNGWADRQKQWYDGYYVLMPDKGESQRWIRPHQPGNYTDGVYYAEDELPDDAVQLHHIELYERFAENDIGEFFFRQGDWNTRNAYVNASHQTVNTASLDRRLKELCEAARVDNDILIFTIAFSAPIEGQTAMKNCATAPGYYYNADPESLAKAFDSIAASITQLRLTQ